MSKESAKAIADKQRHYSRLHHLMRIDGLEKRQREQGSLDCEDTTLLKQSRCVVAQEDIMYGYNSVDLDDLEYIQILDAYATLKVQDTTGKAE